MTIRVKGSFFSKKKDLVLFLLWLLVLYQRFLVHRWMNAFEAYYQRQKRPIFVIVSNMMIKLQKDKAPHIPNENVFKTQSFRMCSVVNCGCVRK